MKLEPLSPQGRPGLERSTQLGEEQARASGRQSPGRTPGPAWTRALPPAGWATWGMGPASTSGHTHNWVAPDKECPKCHQQGQGRLLQKA